MHEPGVISDKQRAAPQHRSRGKQVELADEVDSAMRRDRREQWLRLSLLMPSGKHRDVHSRQWAFRARQTLREFGKVLGSPLFPAPVRSRADREDRCTGRDQCDGGALMARRGPQPRARRRIEIEQPAELAHPMLACVTFGHYPAFACPQQPSERRAAEVDNEVPASGRYGTVKRQPMRRPASLLDDHQPLETRHRLK